MQTAAADTAAVIYQRLDAITGGIAQWLANKREEVWYSEPYMPFNIASIWDDRILFGFTREENGDLVNDPGFAISITAGRVDLDGLVMDGPAGYTRGDTHGAGAYCADFLEEIQRRQQAGVFTGKKVYR